MKRIITSDDVLEKGKIRLINGDDKLSFFTNGIEKTSQIITRNTTDLSSNQEQKQNSENFAVENIGSTAKSIFDGGKEIVSEVNAALKTQNDASLNYFIRGDKVKNVPKPDFNIKSSDIPQGKIKTFYHIQSKGQRFVTKTPDVTKLRVKKYNQIEKNIDVNLNKNEPINAQNMDVNRKIQAPKENSFSHKIPASQSPKNSISQISYTGKINSPKAQSKILTDTGKAKSTGKIISTYDRAISGTSKSLKAFGNTLQKTGTTAAKAGAGVTSAAATGGVSVAASAATSGIKKALDNVRTSATSSIKKHSSKNNDNSNFILIIVSAFMALIIMFVPILGGTLFMTTGGTAKNLSARVESYRPYVAKYAAKYNVSEFTEVILALIMGETGGMTTETLDPMACSESGYNTKYPRVPFGIQDMEYSFDVGIHTFADSLELAECSSPNNLNALYKALQGYNMGPGFIYYCNKNYSGTWSYEAALAFCYYMDSAGNYGDENYIEKFLRFYDPYTGSFGGTYNPLGLISPVPAEYQITTHYGGYAGHKGSDFACPTGTDIYAAADGIVIEAQYHYSWGNYVKIEHKSGNIYTLYAHNQSLLVSVGDIVKQGQVIAKSGSTGNSTGPHCHFELYIGGSSSAINRVDAAPYIGTDLLSKIW